MMMSILLKIKRSLKIRKQQTKEVKQRVLLVDQKHAFVPDYIVTLHQSTFPRSRIMPHDYRGFHYHHYQELLRIIKICWVAIFL